MRPATERGSVARSLVHVGLIATAGTSLVLEPVLAIHMLLGLTFVGLVIAHLMQRRRVSTRLLDRLRTHPIPDSKASRLAAADAVLLAMTTVMLASGLWDWFAGHPTRIRWHAISGVLLAGMLLTHAWRRRRRLLGSRIS
jgi:hypothetical protein